MNKVEIGPKEISRTKVGDTFQDEIDDTVVMICEISGDTYCLIDLSTGSRWAGSYSTIEECLTSGAWKAVKQVTITKVTR
jgi:hypothetical protein